MRKTASNEVLLLITDHGYEIRFGQGKKSLELPAFYILYTVLTSNQFITDHEIITKVFKNHLERDMSDEAIRQSFSRMRRNLPFWDEIIETKSIGNKSARNRKVELHLPYFVERAIYYLMRSRRKGENGTKLKSSQ
ncbi:hypothetical protein KHA80_22565 [Anaerobacillus sp. HL2]|nr:hypothetical protein KHA80_22565 [Anaerobacillus sp. HL2]